MAEIAKNLTDASRWLFLIVGGAILAVPGLIAVGGAIAGYWMPHLTQSTVATVQEAPAPVAPSPANLLNANFQQSVERWAGAAVGFRNQFIRIHSRINWDLFKVPPKAVELVVVGRNQQLYEAHYVDEHRHRRYAARSFDSACPTGALERLVNSVAAIRDESARCCNKPVRRADHADQARGLPRGSCRRSAAQGEAAGPARSPGVLPLDCSKRGIPLVDGAPRPHSARRKAADAKRRCSTRHRPRTGTCSAPTRPRRDPLAEPGSASARLPPPVLEIADMKLSGEPVASSDDLALDDGPADPADRPADALHPQFAVRRRRGREGLGTWPSSAGSFVNQPFYIYEAAGAFSRMIHYWATIDAVIAYSPRATERSFVRGAFDWPRIFNADAIVLELNEVLAEPKLDRAIAAMLEALREKR